MDKKFKTLSIQEQELKDALNNAQKSLQSKERFLSCMSHEIRTPLEYNHWNDKNSGYTFG